MQPSLPCPPEEATGTPPPERCGSGFADICPSRDEVIAALKKLLPRGLAWQENDCDTCDNATIMGRFYAAIGSLFWEVNQRICAAIDEMFCRTARETTLRWAEEYGIPEKDCPAFTDACLKALARIEDPCAFLTMAAAAQGYALLCNMQPCRNPIQVGCARVGQRLGTNGLSQRLTLSIIESESPNKFCNGQRAVAGMARAGCAQLGAPQPPLWLICLANKILPAHLDFCVNVIWERPCPRPLLSILGCETCPPTLC